MKRCSPSLKLGGLNSMGESPSKKPWHASEIMLAGRLRVTSGVVTPWHAGPLCLWVEHAPEAGGRPRAGRCRKSLPGRPVCGDLCGRLRDPAGPPVSLPAVFPSLWGSAPSSVKRGGTVCITIWRICLALETDGRNHGKGRALCSASSQVAGLKASSWASPLSSPPLSWGARGGGEEEGHRALTAWLVVSPFWGESVPPPSFSGPQRVCSANDLFRLCSLFPRLSF